MVPGKSKEESVLNTILLFDQEDRIKSINSIEIKASSRFCNLFDGDTQYELGGAQIMFSVPACGADGLYVVELKRLNFSEIMWLMDKKFLVSVVKPLHEGWITSLFVDAKSQRVYTTSNDGMLTILDINPNSKPTDDGTLPAGTAGGNTGTGNSKPSGVNTSTGAPGNPQGNQKPAGAQPTNPGAQPTNPAAPQPGKPGQPANPALPGQAPKAGNPAANNPPGNPAPNQKPGNKPNAFPDQDDPEGF